MSGSGREAFLDVRKCSGGPPVCPVVLRCHSRMSWSSRKVHPDFREWAGGPPVCPAVVGRPSRMSASGREPSHMSRSSRDALPDVRV